MPPLATASPTLPLKLTTSRTPALDCSVPPLLVTVDPVTNKRLRCVFVVWLSTVPSIVSGALASPSVVA